MAFGRKAARLSLVSLPRLKTCNGIWAHIKVKCLVSGWRVDFAKMEQRVQLNEMFTAEGLQEMTEGRNYCAVDKVLPRAAALADGSLCFVKKCSLTRINVRYAGVASNM